MITPFYCAVSFTDYICAPAHEASFDHTCCQNFVLISEMYMFPQKSFDDAVLFKLRAHMPNIKILSNETGKYNEMVAAAMEIARLSREVKAIRDKMIGDNEHLIEELKVRFPGWL